MHPPGLGCENTQLANKEIYCTFFECIVSLHRRNYYQSVVGGTNWLQLLSSRRSSFDDDRATLPTSSSQGLVNMDSSAKMVAQTRLLLLCTFTSESSCWRCLCREMPGLGLVTAAAHVTYLRCSFFSPFWQLIY